MSNPQLSGPTGRIYVNTKALFDNSENFAFGLRSYALLVNTSTMIQTSTSSATLVLTSSDLYKTLSFNPSSNKIVQMPNAATCKIGSWIEIHNFSTTSNININDSNGTLHTILYPAAVGTVSGIGARMVGVSSAGQTDNGFAGRWVFVRSGVE